MKKPRLNVKLLFMAVLIAGPVLLAGSEKSSALTCWVDDCINAGNIATEYCGHGGGYGSSQICPPSDASVTWVCAEQGGGQSCPGDPLGTCQKEACVPIYSPPADPSNVNVNNSVCSQLTITWTDNATDEDSYYVYKEDLGTRNRVILDILPANSTSYLYVIGSDTSPYTYSVAAFKNGAGWSNRIFQNGGTTSAFDCNANLYGSDKDITGINSLTVLNSPCNSKTDSLPPSTVLKSGDTIKFSINICNSGQGTVHSLYITESMTNLTQGSSGWNVKYNGTALTLGAGSGQYIVSGTPPNQVITVNLSSASLAPSAVGTLTLETTITPSTGTGEFSRFLNSAVICYQRFVGDNGSCNGLGGQQTTSIPLLLFSNRSGPTSRIEVAP